MVPLSPASDCLQSGVGPAASTVQKALSGRASSCRVTSPPAPQLTAEIRRTCCLQSLLRLSANASPVRMKDAVCRLLMKLIKSTLTGRWMETAGCGGCPARGGRLCLTGTLGGAQLQLPGGSAPRVLDLTASPKKPLEATTPHQVCPHMWCRPTQTGPGGA